MTPEEFVYWLSGYVSAIDDRVKVPNENDWARIRASLGRVNQSKHLTSSLNGIGLVQVPAKQMCMEN